MCRALKVLCVAADDASLAELKQAAVAASTDDVRGALRGEPRPGGPVRSA